MKAFIITIKDHKYSEFHANKLFNQLKEKHTPYIFDATTLDSVIEEFNKRNLRYDLKFKMKIETLPKQGRGTLGSLSKASCAMSHFRLYEKCVELNETIMILEHDAVFLSDLTEDIINDFEQSNYELLKLHHHIGTTDWYENKQEKTKYISNKYSSGGTGAYLIKPFIAKELIDYALQNKAYVSDDVYIMQIIPNKIGGLIKEIATTSDNDRIRSTSTNSSFGKDDLATIQ